MKRGFLIVLYMAIGASTQCCLAQYTNDAGQREKHFIYEVKQIDEFFERFNDDKDSFIRKTYARYKKNFSVTRQDLIKSLFNYETNSWNPVIIDSFITVVTRSSNPCFLNFYGDDWFAEVLCRFQQGNTETDVPVIMKLDADENSRARWLIEGVKKNPFPSTGANNIIITTNNNRFIHPASHTNNFIALNKALDDKENLSTYFDNVFFKRSNNVAFYNAVLSGQIKLLYVKQVVYHFLQVNGWVFTVESFPRASLNSGWLINSLKQIAAEEKIKYKTRLLGE